jgi:hypothetical protein
MSLRSARVGEHMPTTRHTPTKIGMTINGKATQARWIENPTTADFLTLLPLTLRMNDLFKREKFGSLPRAISTSGKATRQYALGEIAYWAPGPDLAVFYRHDGEAIPEPGIIVMGKVTSGLESFDVPGPLTVHFARLDQSTAEHPQSTSLNLPGELP